jgi:hypothetical protein
VNTSVEEGRTAKGKEGVVWLCGKNQHQIAGEADSCLCAHIAKYEYITVTKTLPFLELDNT